MAMDEQATAFSKSVGQRLRDIRRQQGLSLEEVESRSAGRWSASAIGAYERGYRNLSLPRLRELADFYSVPMSALIGGLGSTGEDGRPRVVVDVRDPVVLDLRALQGVPEAAPVARFSRAIAAERGDHNGRVLTVRRSDLAVLAALYGLTTADLRDRLDRWGVLAHTEGTAVTA